MSTPSVPWKQIRALVEEQLGHPVFSRSTQAFQGLAYGYALVRIYGSTFDGVVRLRTEGSHYPRNDDTEEVFVDPRDPDLVGSLVTVAVNVLKTGRTVEVGKGIDMREWVFHVPDNKVSEPWTSLIETIKGRGDRPAWDLNPDYQRAAVWTRQQQERFIGHVLSGGAHPPIYVQRYSGPQNAPKGTDWLGLSPEVIDGQQRLRAICAFVQGDIGAQVFHHRKWNTYYWRDMNEAELRGFQVCIHVVYVDLTREQRLRLYHRLNGGTPHTPEELDKVQQMLVSEFGAGE